MDSFCFKVVNNKEHERPSFNKKDFKLIYTNFKVIIFVNLDNLHFIDLLVNNTN